MDFVDLVGLANSVDPVDLAGFVDLVSSVDQVDFFGLAGSADSLNVVGWVVEGVDLVYSVVDLANGLVDLVGLMHSVLGYDLWVYYYFRIQIIALFCSLTCNWKFISLTLV